MTPPASPVIPSDGGPKTVGDPPRCTKHRCRSAVPDGSSARMAARRPERDGRQIPRVATRSGKLGQEGASPHERAPRSPRCRRANARSGGGIEVPSSPRSPACTKQKGLAAARVEQPAHSSPVRERTFDELLPRASGHGRQPTMAQHHRARRPPQRPSNFLRNASLATRCAASFAFECTPRNRTLQAQNTLNRHFLFHNL